MNDSLQDFLHYGYIPDFQKSKPFIQHLQSALSIECEIDGLSEVELIELGIKQLKLTLPSNISDDQVIPLSGGYDSRALLGLVLEHVPAKQIYTFTYGTPGTWDYEIGNHVAKSAGTQHTSLNLSEYTFSFDDFVEIAKQNSPNPVIDTHINHIVYNRYGDDATYWSGFLGDPLAGSHIVHVDTWEDACVKFSQKNRYNLSFSLTNEKYDPVTILPDKPFLSSQTITYYEQLDFIIRQQLHIHPIVTKKDFRVITPYQHENWMRFMLHVPVSMRHKQYLYRKILIQAFPKLFQLPTKSDQGLKINTGKVRRKIHQTLLQLQNKITHQTTKRSINYLDFKTALIERNDLLQIVLIALDIIKSQSNIINLNLDKIWLEHQQGLADHSRGLLQLITLASYLEADNWSE